MALISVTRACGKCRSAPAQKIWMPARHMAITVQNPDPTTRMNNVIVPSRAGDSSLGASIATVARNADRGGHPASSKTKSRKRKRRHHTGGGEEGERGREGKGG